MPADPERRRFLFMLGVTGTTAVAGPVAGALVENTVDIVPDGNVLAVEERTASSGDRVSASVVGETELPEDGDAAVKSAVNFSVHLTEQVVEAVRGEGISGHQREDLALLLLDTLSQVNIILGGTEEPEDDGDNQKKEEQVQIIFQSDSEV